MKEASILHRLRAAKLRPTIARIGVLQVIQASGNVAISAEDVLRSMETRGVTCSMGTAYRVLNQCEQAGILLREWNGNRTALYRLKPVGVDAQALRLLCRTCGRGIALNDALLQERLEHVALLQGIRVANHAVTITVDCTGCVNRSSTSRPYPSEARERSSATSIATREATAAG